MLLHGGLVSTSDEFAATPISYAGHMERLARTFRVIAPDTRGSGGTRHPGGAASATLLCDDVAGLIEAMALDRPLVAGFSEGGLTTLLLGIRHPDLVDAIVSDAGYDTLNPTRRPSACSVRCSGTSIPMRSIRPRYSEPCPKTHRWPTCWEGFRPKSPNGRAGAWPVYLRSTMGRWSRWPGYGYADLAGSAFRC